MLLDPCGQQLLPTGAEYNSPVQKMSRAKKPRKMRLYGAKQAAFLRTKRWCSICVVSTSISAHSSFITV